jgi:hypothetical protein
MTETQQRFLRAIAERVPMAQVVELHLFPPIRQGGVETGVAVVAEDPRLPTVAAAESAGAPEAEAGPSLNGESMIADVGRMSTETTDAQSGAPDTVDAEPQADGAAEPTGESDESSGGANGSAAPAPRFTIHTARYRLTLKGVDRGKWEVDVVAEADAPLAAVDAVVRGVQRRSGEGAEPDRLTSDAFREALDAPLASLER